MGAVVESFNAAGVILQIARRKSIAKGRRLGRDRAGRGVEVADATGLTRSCEGVAGGGGCWRGTGGNEKLKEPRRKWMFAITRKIVYKWRGVV